jgi:hypothetical protein
MEAASAAISPLGFVLDVMLLRVLMSMRKRSEVWSGGARTWLAGVGGWMDVRVGARRSQDCYGGTKAIAVKVKEMRGRRKRNGVNPASSCPIYRGSTKSARYGSFPRTMCLNGSIPIGSRDNLGGFVADWLQP